MSPSTGQQVEWRFADRQESVEAWLRHPAELHMVVYFRPPEPVGNQWYSIMTVTWKWLRKHAEESELGGIWPALLIVPDGSRAEIEKSITEQLTVGWRLVIHNAQPLSGLPEPVDL